MVDRATLPAGSRLSLTYDEGTPILADLAAPPELPDAWRAPGSAELALALAAQTTGAMPPLARAEASAATWPLPAGVRRLRVALAGGGESSLRLAVQLRASRAPGLPAQGPRLSTETEVRAWLKRAASGDASALPWLPLHRWLDAESRAFRAGVALDPALAPTLQGRPGSLPAIPQPLRVVGSESIESRIQAFRNDPAPRRPQALEHLIEGLDRLGEGSLADQWLKGALCFAEDPALRQKAGALLEARLMGSERLLSCLADQALTAPTQGNLKKLGLALLREGRPRLALLVATLLPPSAAPELWVRAGRLTQREDVLRQGLAAWGASPEALVWEGIRHLDLGQPAEALARWEKAGESGAPWRQAVSSPSVSPSPGPRIWRATPEVVHSNASALDLHALQLDTHQQAFLARPGTPVRLRIPGPVRVRVEARPMHAKGKTTISEGWLHLREVAGSLLEGKASADDTKAAWHGPLPYLDNRPAAALAVSGREDLIPGQALVREWNLGPGNHEVTADFGPREGCIAVSLEQPEVAFPGKQRAGVQAIPASRWSSPSRGRSGVYVAEGNRFRWIEAASLRRILLAEGAASSQASSPPSPQGSGQPVPRPAQNLDALLAHSLSQDAQEMAARIEALAWAAEQQPTRRRDLLAHAERLAAHCPGALSHTQAMEILRRGAVWTSLGTTGTGAGLRNLPRSPFDTNLTTNIE